MIEFALKRTMPRLSNLRRWSLYVKLMKKRFK